MKFESYCSQAGPKVTGPGKVQQSLFLHVQATDNPGKFTKPDAAAGFSLDNVSTDVVAQFAPGKRYTITIEETPDPVAS